MSIKTKLTGLALLGSVVAYSTGAQAGTQTWDFMNPPSFDFNGNGNSWMMTSSDGINLTVTGWSDTQDITGDDRIEDARLQWASSGSLGIINRDEASTGDTGSPDHSVDSYRSGGDSDGDYEMLLLTFDTAVDLTGIDLSWGRDGTVNNRADISILAYDGTGASGLAGNRWSEILSSNGGNYDSIGQYNNVGLNYYGVNAGNVSSNQWLIGVYNPVFGAGLSDYGDGMKLDYITTETDDTPPTGDVPVPGSFGLVLLGLAALRKRLMRG